MVHIIQVLCPSRHCIFAISYEHPEMSDEDGVKAAKNMLNEMLAGNLINPWCALCKSEDIHNFDIGITAFKTMEEAMPHLKANEIAQMRTQIRLLAEQN
jgi:hypothetical protein